jgi:hypothetical protein
MEKPQGRYARCLALVVDTISIELQSPDFIKLCDATFNALALEFAKSCREREIDIKIAVVEPFDVNGRQWFERTSEWDFVRKKSDEIISSSIPAKSVSLGGQLARLLSLVNNNSCNFLF